MSVPPPGISGPETFALVDRVQEVLRFVDVRTERSEQSAAGPSQIGGECERQLAYIANGMGKVNPGDKWQANVGTAIHVYMAEAYTKAGGVSGRYLIEYRISVTTPSGLVIPGTLDLYDRVTRELIDFKTVGQQRAKKIRERGSPKGYKTQLDVYGVGLLACIGERPLRVANVYLPRDGKLAEIFGYSEPWDERNGLEALARYDRIHVDSVALTENGEHMERLGIVPTTPSLLCGYCDFFKAESPSAEFGCTGKKLEVPE